MKKSKWIPVSQISLPQAKPAEPALSVRLHPPIDPVIRQKDESSGLRSNQIYTDHNHVFSDESIRKRDLLDYFGSETSSSSQNIVGYTGQDETLQARPADTNPQMIESFSFHPFGDPIPSSSQLLDSTLPVDSDFSSSSSSFHFEPLTNKAESAEDLNSESELSDQPQKAASFDEDDSFDLFRESKEDYDLSIRKKARAVDTSDKSRAKSQSTILKKQDIFLRHVNTGTAIRLRSKPLRIGSGGKCDYVVSFDSGIAPLHAEVSLIEGVVYIEDLDSKNQTYIDYAQVSSRTEFNPGEVLRLGPNQIFELFTFEEDSD